ncbi:MAG: class I SAM-dependent methyltransferase [Rhizobiaceae bacterium]
MTNTKDPEFQKRRAQAQAKVQLLDKDVVHNNPKREQFFETVYDRAEGDAAAIPWADLDAKHKLAEWLSRKSDHKGRAIDVGCGLGDNAEALVRAGYETTAFDFSPKAINWAKERFPDSSVSYHVADLFDLPERWIGSFDLVHECYTLQSIPPETLRKSMPAIANLLAPGGMLLVYTRIRPDGDEVDGPPWPLEESKTMSFDKYGLKLVSRENFILERPDKTISHLFCIWQKPE